MLLDLTETQGSTICEKTDADPQCNIINNSLTKSTCVRKSFKKTPHRGLKLPSLALYNAFFIFFFCWNRKY